MSQNKTPSKSRVLRHLRQTVKTANLTLRMGDPELAISIPKTDLDAVELAWTTTNTLKQLVKVAKEYNVPLPTTQTKQAVAEALVLKRVPVQVEGKMQVPAKWRGIKPISHGPLETDTVRTLRSGRTVVTPTKSAKTSNKEPKSAQKPNPNSSALDLDTLDTQDTLAEGQTDQDDFMEDDDDDTKPDVRKPIKIPSKAKEMDHIWKLLQSEDLDFGKFANTAKHKIDLDTTANNATSSLSSLSDPAFHSTELSGAFQGGGSTLAVKIESRARQALYIKLAYLRRSDPFDMGQSLMLGRAVLFMKGTPAKVALGEEWSCLFVKLVELYCKYHPHMRAPMMRHHSWIMECALHNSYSWSKLIEYDERFREKHQGPQAPYGVPDLAIAAMVLFPGAAPRQIKRKIDTPKSVCYTWLNGKVCKKASCPFRHSCVDCPDKTTHDPKSCPRKRSKN